MVRASCWQLLLWTWVREASSHPRVRVRPGCDLTDAAFLSSGDAHIRVALSSFPGSGNTWARILLEKSTGKRTGSEYFDKKLVSAGLVGEGSAHLNDTICFKTHWPVIQGPEPSFERVIVVLRHPANASLSYAAYSLSQTMSHDNDVGEAQMREHMASSSLPSLDNQWHYYLWIYEMYAKAWLERIRRLGERALLVRYEDLRADCPSELQRMVKFLGENVPAEQLACACETASLESTHRRPRPYGPRDVLTAADERRLVELRPWLQQLGYSASLENSDGQAARGEL